MSADDRTAVITRYRYQVRVALPHRRPMPREIYDPLTEQLEYIHKRYLRGIERVRADRPVETQLRRLYSYDEFHTLTCAAGYTDRIRDYFAGLGWGVRHVLLAKWAQPPRPRCFEEDWARVDRYFTFRTGQRECVAAIAARCKMKVGGYVDAAAGWGKTETFAAVGLLYPYAKIGVVVRKLDLVGRTVERLTNYLPSIGQVGGGRRRYGRITVYSLDSLHLFDKDTDLLLADEVHEHVAEKYVDPYGEHCYDAVRIGFSANAMDRADGSSARVEAMFGPRIFQLTSKEAIALGLTVPILVHWNPVHLVANPIDDSRSPCKYTDVQRQRLGYWRNDERNRIIAARARAYGDDEQVLILVDKIEHALHLRRFLPEYEIAYGTMGAADRDDYIARGLLPEGYRPPTRLAKDVLRERFERGEIFKMIATGVYKQGISPDYLQVLIWAQGGQDKIAATQGPSRAARILVGGDKPVGIVEDFGDDWDDRFHKHSVIRRRHYAANGWENILPEARGRSQATGRLRDP